MPSKLLHPAAVPSIVQERLQLWGRCIRSQRIRQNIRAADLSQRMRISEATLARIERGDPGASASNYLSALLILGIFDVLAPMPEPRLWDANASQQRARTPLPRYEHDDDF